MEVQHRMRIYNLYQYGSAEQDNENPHQYGSEGQNNENPYQYKGTEKV